MLQRLQERGDHMLDKIKGCVVDSAPKADPDSQSYVDINLQEAKKKTQAASTYHEDLLQPGSRVETLLSFEVCLYCRMMIHWQVLVSKCVFVAIFSSRKSADI